MATFPSAADATPQRAARPPRSSTRWRRPPRGSRRPSSAVRASAPASCSRLAKQGLIALRQAGSIAIRFASSALVVADADQVERMLTDEQRARWIGFASGQTRAPFKVAFSTA